MNFLKTGTQVAVALVACGGRCDTKVVRCCGIKGVATAPTVKLETPHYKCWSQGNSNDFIGRYHEELYQGPL